jgi:hypothetical protein
LSEITPEKSTTQLPCAYYSSPPAEKRLFPRWVPLGCGGISLAILIVLFLAGAWVNSGGATNAIHWFFGRLQSELLASCDRDVTAAQKSAFTSEFTTLQQKITAGKTKSDDLLGVFQLISNVSSDKHVTSAELDELTKKVRDVNNAR